MGGTTRGDGAENRCATVLSVASAVPDQIVTTEQIVERLSPEKLSADFVRRLTGVIERRHARPGTSSSDLAVAAGQRALERSATDPSDIDLLVFAAASHDFAEPATANRVQDGLGCTGARVVDIKNACNSFLDALDLVASQIESGRSELALIAVGEVISPFISYEFHGLAQSKLLVAGLTLGDAGASAIIGRNPPFEGVIYPGTFWSDGSQWRLSTIMAGGSLFGRDFNKAYFECDSAKLLRLGLDNSPKIIQKALDSVGWRIEDVDLVVPHQVSVPGLEYLSEMLGYSLDRVPINLTHFGNTAAASIPLALATSIESGRVHPGDRILLVGAAAGFSVAAVPLVLGPATGSPSDSPQL